MSSYQYRNVKVNLYILGKGTSQTSQKESRNGKFELKPACKTSLSRNWEGGMETERLGALY